MAEPENGGRDHAGRWTGCGNPKGKPRGTQNRVTRLLDSMAAADAQEVLRTVLNRAKAGDMVAAGTILSRIWAARKGRPLLLDLPQITVAQDVVAALGMIAANVADGTVTPTEAAELTVLIEASRKALETVTMADDVRAIKAKLGLP